VTAARVASGCDTNKTAGTGDLHGSEVAAVAMGELPGTRRIVGRRGHWHGRLSGIPAARSLTRPPLLILDLLGGTRFNPRVRRHLFFGFGSLRNSKGFLTGRIGAVSIFIVATDWIVPIRGHRLSDGGGHAPLFGI